MNAGSLLTWLVAVLTTASPALASDDATKAQPLFHFAKSDSRNEVHYAARFSEDCRFIPEPIHVYWMRRTDRLEYRRELNWLETHFAYGVNIESQQGNRINFTIAGDTSRPIQVELTKTESGCHAEPMMRLLGEWAKPEHGFIELLERKPLFPKILHVDLHGRRDNANAVCERITEAGNAGTPCL
jgi:hypothetical protein